MSARISPLKQLLGEQAAASDPARMVWLSASAGTGKTHVLTARVLRLLLQGVDPSTILCLTFTKAAAAEMAERIRSRLAHWARLRTNRLKEELFALGEPTDAAAIDHARTLFAKVLDARGGGLRIQTIHAFCQTLLASFPVEGGMIPGFRPLDGQQEAALARSTLASLLVEAESGGDHGLIRDVQALSHRMGEDKAEAYLRACARHPDAMTAVAPGIEARLRRLFDLPSGDILDAMIAACHDDVFDCAGLRRIAAANRAWGTKTGGEHGDIAAAFLAANGADRAGMIDDVIGIALTKAGERRAYSKKLIDAEPGYEALCDALAEGCGRLVAMRETAAFVDLLSAGIRAGAAYATAFERAKAAAGAVDFDDLIRAADRLLTIPGMGDWVRYKLDSAIDHILVDEAQDTNAAQWRIVSALAEEFFAGEGAHSDRWRTLFTVGDFKQAIYGFQGTSPVFFQAAQHLFGERGRAAERPFTDLSLDRSFRSTPPVLAVVDRVLADLGHEAFGLERAAPPHATARVREGGRVTLWRPHVAIPTEELAGEESWAQDATRGFAIKLARQVKEWLDTLLHLHGQGRPLRPEDIMILVRKRGELASLIVARLHAEGVPVAGVDRLRLTAPLAVRDLLAAIRFALQPEDDLNLANLLVSPIFGLSQDDLFALAYDRKGSLWDAVRGHPAAAGLSDILGSADLTTPYDFLETILSGPLRGRQKLMQRLGPEALDPIEELLTAALQFESSATPSLQVFLDWFDRGDIEIKRDPSAPHDAVRVMTVHGAKGLQAPLVILADATADPESARADIVELDVEGATVPIPRPRKAEATGLLAEVLEETARDDMREHWRLLYVAATRAEEHLVIGGALGPKARGVPPESSWYTALDNAIGGMGVDWIEDARWSGVREIEDAGSGRVAHRRRPLAVPPIAEPQWLRQPAPREQRPPRPLAPSLMGEDRVADPPPSHAMREAAERGRLLHGLFERLPNLPLERRESAAVAWLSGMGVPDDAARAALVRDACAILSDPRFAEVFAPGALAEAPIAAVVAGRVVAGTVDRLLVRDDRVLVVDFKTGRRAPEMLADLPGQHVQQIAAYVVALEKVFPGRLIEAALLYTAGPFLHILPPDLLDGAKPRFDPSEQSLAADS
ncbi:double-strand break repair helicase AddA [Sphingomonas sp. ID0503]|uniref:double-strand break repair helicase AddA n=1 Tax=Sphingomonas sp. ID0503 TaxID=3399691 RepID=UPI003AFB7569